MSKQYLRELVVVLTHAHPNKIGSGEMGNGLISLILYRFVSNNLQRFVEHTLYRKHFRIHFLYILPFVRYCSS